MLKGISIIEERTLVICETDAENINQAILSQSKISNGFRILDTCAIAEVTNMGCDYR